jgi:hypothetical protein
VKAPIRPPLTDEQRAAYKKFHPDLDKACLEKAGEMKLSAQDLEHLSGIAALYLWDVAAEFEPPELWSWRQPAAKLTREMEIRRREWLVREVESVWRNCGGEGKGGYWKPVEGKHGGPLIDLIEELLNQFGAPQKQRSSRSLYRSIIGKR